MLAARLQERQLLDREIEAGIEGEGGSVRPFRTAEITEPVFRELSRAQHQPGTGVPLDGAGPALEDLDDLVPAPGRLVELHETTERLVVSKPGLLEDLTPQVTGAIRKPRVEEQAGGLEHRGDAGAVARAAREQVDGLLLALRADVEREQ